MEKLNIDYTATAVNTGGRKGHVKTDDGQLDFDVAMPKEIGGEGGKTKSKVNQAGNYTQPTKRKRIFNRIKAGGKGGAPGQWSARKAQMLAKAYKKAGGGYKD